MPKVNTYNVKDIDLVLGTRNLEAFFQETTIDFEKMEDTNTMSKGLNGDITFNESNDTSYTLKFTLKSDSEDNEYIRGLYASKNIFAGFLGNKLTGERIALSGCKFQTKAPISDGKELSGREWNVLVGVAVDLT